MLNAMDSPIYIDVRFGYESKIYPPAWFDDCVDVLLAWLLWSCRFFDFLSVVGVNRALGLELR